MEHNCLNERTTLLTAKPRFMYWGFIIYTGTLLAQNQQHDFQFTCTRTTNGIIGNIQISYLFYKSFYDRILVELLVPCRKPYGVTLCNNMFFVSLLNLPSV